MSLRRFILACCILVVLLAGCVPSAPILPTPTATTPPRTETNTPQPSPTRLPPTITPTLKPTATATPTLTPTIEPYDYSKLPGWFAYMDFDCKGLCTNVSIIRPDLSERRILTEHQRGLVDTIDWSPDGRALAFTFFTLGEAGHEELRLVNVASQVETTLVSLPQSLNAEDLVWSPDSRSLVYTVVDDEKKTSQLMRVNVSSRAATNLSRNPAFVDEHPAWSSDGKSIVFASNRPGTDKDLRQLWIMNADGSNPRRLIPAEEATAYKTSRPSWSPDRQVIAFLRTGEAAGQQGVGEMNGLWVMNAGGDNPVQLNECPAPVDQPIRWAPRGRVLAYLCQGNILLVNADSGATVTLTNQSGNYYAVWWAPDSSALIYMEKIGDMARKIHLAVFEDDRIHQVDSDTIVENPAWSPVADLP